MAAMARLNRIWRQHHQLCKPVQALRLSCHLHPPLRMWNMDPACWLWENDTGFRNQVYEEPSSYLLLRAQDQRLLRSKINFLVGPQEPLLATVKGRKLAWFRHATRHDSSPKPSFRAVPWRLGDAVVDRKKILDGQHQRVDIPAMPEPLARARCRKKRLEENLWRIVSHVSPTIRSVKGLNWTELKRCT